MRGDGEGSNWLPRLPLAFDFSPPWVLRGCGGGELYKISFYYFIKYSVIIEFMAVEANKLIWYGGGGG